MDLLLAALLGTVVGLLMGSLGGGGAVLSIPVLVYLLDQPVRDATTISLVVVLFGALVGLASMRGSGRVDWRTGLVFGGLGVAGAVVGARLAELVDPQVLMAAFGVLLATVSVVVWRRATHHDADDGGGSVSLGRLLPTATGVGALTGFFGVGGGFAAVPALSVVMRMPAAAATATSLVVIGVNAIAALVTRAFGTGFGHLPWGIVAAFAVGTGIGTSLGTRISGRVAGPVLLRAFAVFLVLVGIAILAETFLA